MHKLLVFVFSDCHSYFSIGTEYVTLIWEKMPLIIKIWLALEGDSGGTRLTSHINLSNDRDLYDLRQCRIIKKYAGLSLPGSTNWLI